MPNPARAGLAVRPSTAEETGVMTRAVATQPRPFGAAAPCDAEADPDRRFYRILHVDDDRADHLLLLRKLAKSVGPRFDIVLIDSFDEALDRLGSDAFDVGLIDYKLAGQTGLDLIERSGGRLCQTPLVLLTGRGDRAIELEATRAGAFDFLDKNELSATLLERTIRNVRVQFETEHQLRKSEAQLREAKAEAEAANKAKSDFMMKVAHDFGVPLNAVLGFAETIRDQRVGAGQEERYRDYAGDIYRSGLLLLSMLRDVHELARIESGVLAMRDEPVALDRAVEQALRLMNPTAESAGLALDAKIESTRTALLADRQMLDRMLANLLSNAVKFTPDGGRIVVRVENGPSDRRNGPRSEPNRDLRIVVEDSGVGMPMLDFRRATEPFLSKDRPYPTATPQGDGIGLTIVRSMMDCHGGTLTLEPAPRGGLRAVLTFPAARVL